MILRKTALKLSTIILLTTLVLITLGLFASNLVLRNKYDKLDKNDRYWSYTKVLQQPFKHIKINADNITQIVFQQNPTASVRVSNYWDNYKRDNSFKAYVKNDTLYLTVISKLKNTDENKRWAKDNDFIMVLAPQLLSVDATNTHLELDKFKQNSIYVNLTGKSVLQVESFVNNFDSLSITQRDSSITKFGMSEDFKGSPNINFQHVNANLYGNTTLDMGHGYINDFKLNMSDSSFVILSGKSISKLHK